MFFAKIPRHTRQNAITEGDLECILTRNCEGTEQLQTSNHYINNWLFLSYNLISECKRGKKCQCIITLFWTN